MKRAKDPKLHGLYRSMERYIDGDARAYSEVYGVLSGRLRGFLLRMVSDRDAVEDILQVTFLKAHLARERFKLQTGDPDSAVQAWYFAIARNAAMDHLRAQDQRLAEVAANLKAPVTEVPARVKALMDERKALANEVAQLRRELAMGGGAATTTDREVNGIRFLPQVVSGVSGKDLPALVDELKSRVGSGAVLVVADTGGKAAVAAGVTQDLTARLSAVDIVKAAAEALGGKGGGGRPDMAQAGGTDASKADDAIQAAEKVIGAVG